MDKNIIKRVLTYSGKVLEKITHKETPWIEARKGYNPFERRCTVISKEQIKDYFQNINKEYDISTLSGINRYIYDQMNSE